MLKPEYRLRPLAQYKCVLNKPVSHAFLKNDVRHLLEAIQFVNILPYGRNTERHNYNLVLTEQRGTCSTKHALISALATELGAPLGLCLGSFLMDRKNTPAISAVLQQHQLAALLEAHVYLKFNETCFDVTFPYQTKFPAKEDFLAETIILPNQIGGFKKQWHHNQLAAWRPQHAPQFDIEQLWNIREACMVALTP